MDVVFYGHVHAYERSYPLRDGKIDTENGVTYIMSGGAGGHLEDFAPTNYTFSNRLQRGNHLRRDFKYLKISSSCAWWIQKGG